jgi:hypothetical protein
MISHDSSIWHENKRRYQSQWYYLLNIVGKTVQSTFDDIWSFKHGYIITELTSQKVNHKKVKHTSSIKMNLYRTKCTFHFGLCFLINQTSWESRIYSSNLSFNLCLTLPWNHWTPLSIHNVCFPKSKYFPIISGDFLLSNQTSFPTDIIH